MLRMVLVLMLVSGGVGFMFGMVYGAWQAGQQYRKLGRPREATSVEDDPRRMLQG